MFWSALFFNKTKDIVFLEGKQTSKEYTGVFNSYFLPIGKTLGDQNYMY